MKSTENDLISAKQAWDNLAADARKDLQLNAANFIKSRYVTRVSKAAVLLRPAFQKNGLSFTPETGRSFTGLILESCVEEGLISRGSDIEEENPAYICDISSFSVIAAAKADGWSRAGL